MFQQCELLQEGRVHCETSDGDLFDDGSATATKCLAAHGLLECAAFTQVSMHKKRNQVNNA